MLFRRVVNAWFLSPYLSQTIRQMLFTTGDPVRFGTLYLSLEEVQKKQIPGSLAECGVYKGSVSKFVHTILPDRKLYLFDTFEGFDLRDSDTQGDNRFKDTSEEAILNMFNNNENIVVRKGFFPTTTAGLENETFAIVLIDLDKYEPTVAALEFFYSRMSYGGFIFVHDYTSPESNWACRRALDAFLAGRPESPLMIPDGWGTAFFRKT